MELAWRLVAALAIFMVLDLVSAEHGSADEACPIYEPGNCDNPGSSITTMTFDELSNGQLISATYLARHDVTSITTTRVACESCGTSVLQGGHGNSACPVRSNGSSPEATAEFTNFPKLDGGEVRMVFSRAVTSVCVRITGDQLFFGYAYFTIFSESGTNLGRQGFVVSQPGRLCWVREESNSSFTSMTVEGSSYGDSGWCIDDITICVNPSSSTSSTSAADSKGLMFILVLSVLGGLFCVGVCAFLIAGVRHKIEKGSTDRPFGTAVVGIEGASSPPQSARYSLPFSVEPARKVDAPPPYVSSDSTASQYESQNSSE